MTDHQALDPTAISRCLNRIAHEILERTPDSKALGFIGIHTRGVPLAHRLSALVASFEPSRKIWPTGALDISFHRDDMADRLPIPKDTRVDFPLEGTVVILVDDVLSSGRTVRAALHALLDLGRPEAIRLAVLVDRGHRQLPIRADYVGKNLPTRPQDRVRVQVQEIDGVDLVRVEEGGDV